MTVDFAVLRKEGIETTSAFKAVHDLAEQLRLYLEQEESQQLILKHHVLHASSAAIQRIILPKALELGFESERKGLFAIYPVSALRPDYFCQVGETGILLEVERGKTTTNNMDLLDLWKCHICDHASYLFLVVPKARPSAKGTVIRHFSHVSKRLAPFFEPRNYVNVDAVYLFGY